MVFSEGSLYDVVRSSIFISGVFLLYKIGDIVLVDGVVVDKVLGKVLKENGCEFVVGVDVLGKSLFREFKNIFEMIMIIIDIMGEEIFRFK